MAFTRRWLSPANRITACPRLNFWGSSGRAFHSLQFNKIKEECLEYVGAYREETINHVITQKHDPVESKINPLVNSLIRQMETCKVDSDLVSVLSKPEYQQGSLIPIINTCLDKIKPQKLFKKFKKFP